MNKFNIELKVTERDKKIIKYFGIFLIVIGFTFLIIKPCFDQAVAYSDQKSELEFKLDEMQSKVDNKADLEHQMENYKKAFVTKSNDFYGLMTNQEIDNMVTGLFQTYGLTARDLAISIDEKKAALSNYNISQDSKDTGKKEYSTIYVSNITVKSDGNKDNFKNLIDHIYNDMPGILIENYSISSAATSNTTSTTLNLSIDIFMVSKE